MRQILRFMIAERTVLMGEVVGELGSNENFDGFDRVQQQGPETLIEDTNPPYLIQCGAFTVIIRTRLSITMQVPGQAEITGCLKTLDQQFAVGDGRSAHQLIGLLFEGKGGFRALHATSLPSLARIP